MNAKVAVIALLVVSIAGGVGIGSYIYVRNQTIEEVADFQTELRDGLVQNCERNGNPLREAVEGMLQDQIDQSQNPALLHQFFPQIPPALLDHLVEEENERRRKRIKQIEPVDCAAQYPR